MRRSPSCWPTTTLEGGTHHGPGGERSRGPRCHIQDVLELMRKGATTAEISERLFVSPTTVRSHISSIVRKLGVPTRQEAIKLLVAREGPAPD